MVREHRLPVGLDDVDRGSPCRRASFPAPPPARPRRRTRCACPAPGSSNVVLHVRALVRVVARHGDDGDRRVARLGIRGRGVELRPVVDAAHQRDAGRAALERHLVHQRAARRQERRRRRRPPRRAAAPSRSRSRAGARPSMASSRFVRASAVRIASMTIDSASGSASRSARYAAGSPPRTAASSSAAACRSGDLRGSRDDRVDPPGGRHLGRAGDRRTAALLARRRVQDGDDPVRRAPPQAPRRPRTTARRSIGASSVADGDELDRCLVRGEGEPAVAHGVEDRRVERVHLAAVGADVDLHALRVIGDRGDARQRPAPRRAPASRGRRRRARRRWPPRPGRPPGPSTGDRDGAAR